MKKAHELKTIQPYFDKVNNNEKGFELTKMDRDYEIGDTLILQEYDPYTNTYSGREVNRVIGYILEDSVKFGLKKGYGILGFLSF